jgi:hypothetical protein
VETGRSVRPDAATKPALEASPAACRPQGAPRTSLPPSGSSSEFYVQSEKAPADGVGDGVPRAPRLFGPGQQNGELLTGPGFVSRLAGHSGNASPGREGVWVLGAHYSLAFTRQGRKLFERPDHVPC